MIKNSGFLLILSLVIISIILSVGLGVFFIIMREFQLASYGRDSQIAFHAADSGIECARYWDVKKGEFEPAAPHNINCFEQSVNPPASIDPLSGSTVYNFDLNLGNNSCVNINVKKTLSGMTIIESRGYMPCAAGSLRRVERGIRMTY